MANDGYNVTMPACFGAQNAKPILSVVIGHPLDEARQDFLARRLQLRAHSRLNLVVARL
jgi:hypothetical protein